MSYYSYNDPNDAPWAPWRLDGADDTDSGEVGASPSAEAAEDDTEDEGDSESTPAAEGTGDKPRSRTIPRERFDSLNEKYNEYRELGLTPSQAKSKLEQLARYENAQAEYERAQEEERRVRTSDTRRDALRAEVIGLINEEQPGFLEEIEASKRDRSLYARSHNTTGREHLRQLYKDEFGVDPADKTLNRLINLVKPDINDDDELLNAYWDPQLQRGTLKKVFEGVKGDLFVPVATALGARDIEKVKQRRESNLSRATTSEGPAAPSEGFKSKHQPGTTEWEKDFKAYESRMWAEAMS